jgi:hypothetical protein
VLDDLLSLDAKLARVSESLISTALRERLISVFGDPGYRELGISEAKLDGNQAGAEQLVPQILWL